MTTKKHLGDFEFLVIGAVLRLGRAYGAAVREEIEDRTGREVSMGAVHATLKRMESKAYLRSYLGEPRPERGGKARRYFEAEAPGREAFEDAARAFQAMIEGAANPAVGGA